MRSDKFEIGGESSFLFKYNPTSPHLLTNLPQRNWILPSISTWSQPTITILLDIHYVSA